MRTVHRALVTVVIVVGEWTNGSAIAANLDGMYLMTRFWPSSGLEMAAYAFNNGDVVMNPVGSDKTVNVAAERALHPNQVGKFKIEGNQLVVVMNGSTKRSKFEPQSKGCFGWDAGIFCPVKPFSAGTTLDGTFSGGASVGGGAAMSGTTITFFKNGTYQRESVGSVASRGSRTAVTGGSVGNERGKYRIDGAALHLLPDRGKEAVFSTFPYDDGSKGPTPRRVYFGGTMLKRIR